MKFLDRLNSQHKNLQFTIEKSTNTLPFLDVELKIHNNNLQSWIWCFSEFRSNFPVKVEIKLN